MGGTLRKAYVVRTIEEEGISDNDTYKKQARLHLKSYDDIEDYFSFEKAS